MKDHLECGPRVQQLYREACGGDADALTFLNRFDEYFEAVVKFIETGNRSMRDFMELLAKTNTLYSLPFYARHALALQLPVLQALNGLADGLAWQTNGEDWKRQWGETARIGMVELTLAVATMQVGFSGARKLSAEVREMGWATRGTETMNSKITA